MLLQLAEDILPKYGKVNNMQFIQALTENYSFLEMTNLIIVKRFAFCHSLINVHENECYHLVLHFGLIF